MKKYKTAIQSFFLLTFWLFFINSVHGQLKQAHLNTQEIIESMPETKYAKNQLEEMRKNKQVELDKMVVEYKNKAQVFQQKEKHVNDVNKETIGKELQNMNVELQELGQRIKEAEMRGQQEIAAKSDELFNPIFIKLNKAITAIGKERSIPYIFDISQQSVIYSGAGGEDIGPLVKTKLGIVSIKPNK